MTPLQGGGFLCACVCVLFGFSAGSAEVAPVRTSFETAFGNTGHENSGEGVMEVSVLMQYCR